MINISIKIIGLGILDKAQALLILRNKECIIYEGMSFDGKIDISLESNCLYNLTIVSWCGIKRYCFYVDDKRNNYCFSIFNDLFMRKIIFQLNDANYDNLPIQKGEIKLWTK